jgi:hypothetical protein
MPKLVSHVGSSGVNCALHLAPEVRSAEVSAGEHWGQKTGPFRPIHQSLLVVSVQVPAASERTRNSWHLRAVMHSTEQMSV